MINGHFWNLEVRQGIPGKGNSICLGTEAYDKSLACLEKNQEFGVTEAGFLKLDMTDIWTR